MDFTVEVWKKDKRIKKGKRLVTKIDFTDQSKEIIKKFMHKVYPSSLGYTIKIFETFVTRRNLMSGEEFQERYDTPGYCSPSTETYWSS